MTDSIVEEGKIRWFNKIKGYGFLETDRGDLFIHLSVVEKAYEVGLLPEADLVKNSIIQFERGPGMKPGQQVASRLVSLVKKGPSYV